MKKRNVTSRIIALTMVGAGLFAVGCNKTGDDPIPTPPPTDAEIFHIAYGTGTGGIGDLSTATLLPFTDITKGEISFQNNGFRLPDTRTHRFYTLSDGKYIYNLEYQNGNIKKYENTTSPFYQQVEDKDSSWESENKYWGVARVDLKNKTAIKMNLPENLWLASNQNMKLGKDGKLYAAIAPLNANGNIYIFDPKRADANGFTKGATLKIVGDAFYLGVF
ncbi:hypothetical protein [Capnocytophaga catalasegens]|uniref:Lipoprotein n=1 Tax=Capnocytophaga catalasegens TaxID=1004260 RepID=A0AAV5AZ15_9FLAO|nr:hypothetical protein [Capnocytophaga catalasegens]GIZ14504.1 hypothetical protein RCZ03_05050 [Capnocytophaga catalasegens]GJM50706.1 hypothetical protein RCZ15_16790 [Capnocytophaga catalasegens]GJM51859.1 hypothetical protein RCZ16_01770 [Capnocytophaga catalasegens]